MQMPTTESLVRTDRASCPSPHSAANKAARALWGAVWRLLFRPTPRFWHAPRRALLRVFGARVGRGAQIMPSVSIWAPWNLALGDYATVGDGADLYSVDRIEIGAHATISRRAFLCTATHEVHHPNMPLKTAPIRIGPGAWVAAEAFVHPGVTLGADAVAGARAVVLRDVPPRRIVAGNPARDIGERKLEK